MRRNWDYLKIARTLGLPVLLWAVFTKNPFLILAFILGWIAQSGGKPKAALAAEILYIVGAITASAVTVAAALLGNVISVISGITQIAGGASKILLYTAIADVVIGATAVCSHKGRKQLLQTAEERLRIPTQSIGFFNDNTK